MRFLLPAIGVFILIVTGYAIQIRFPPNHVAEAETKLGISVYDIHANKRDVKTVPEQEVPLP
jgi:hypothetical protein